MGVEELLERVKKKIDPGDKHAAKVERVVKRINKSLAEKGIVAECVVGGSFAKGTHLKGDHDVDLFVRFDKRYKDKELPSLLGKALPFKAKKLHGSRDYYQFTYQGLTFEAVPVIKISNYSEARNVTDLSPLHVEYVKKHFKKNPWLAGEVRIAKQFCKANKVYGAESYIQGFSGHVVDLLIIHYQGFLSLARAASQWGKRVVIDLEKHWSNPLKELNKSKLESPLVVVDPLQPDRNASAALSVEKFELFKTRCKEFLQSPSEEFFKPKKLSLKELKRKAGEDELIVLEVWGYKNKEDVLGCKLRQVHEYVYKKLLEQEWGVVESDWELVRKKSGKGLEKELHMLSYFIVSKEGEPYIERQGPPLHLKEEVKRFTKKHPNAYVRGGRVYAKVKKKHSTPEGLVQDCLNHKYVQERVKKCFFLEV